MIAILYFAVGLLVALAAWPFVLIYERKKGWSHYAEGEALFDCLWIMALWPAAVLVLLLWLIGRFILAPIYRPIIKRLEDR